MTHHHTPAPSPGITHLGGSPSLESAEASLQHVELLTAKIQRLQEALIEAEAQAMMSARRAVDDSPEPMVTALALFRRWRSAPRAMSGRTRRWDAEMPEGLSWAQCAATVDYGPNGPNGSWRGPWPLAPKATRPRHGICVVYVLFDQQNVPCYVGSSGAFRERLTAHHNDGKAFVAWTAFPVSDREAAYQLEDRLLREHKPYLNKKAGR